MAHCTNPNFFGKLGWVNCGKCPNCLKNKRKEWADRLQVEMSYHPYCYFVTLTYSPENYPEDESLSKKTLQDFKKRLEYYAGYTPRSFCVGEYGDETFRPHYHAAIFSDKDDFNSILSAWQLGRVSVERLTPGRCKYVSGYVTKKMTKKDDERLNGRLPEFFLSSRRPALGDGLLVDILNRIASDEAFFKRLLDYTYPPQSVRIGGKHVRLPAYIRRKLGPMWKLFNEEKQKQEKKDKFQKDFLVFKAIYRNLCEMQGIDDDYELQYRNYDGDNWFKHISKELKKMAAPVWKDIEERQQKADKMKKRRYL